MNLLTFPQKIRKFNPKLFICRSNTFQLFLLFSFAFLGSAVLVAQDCEVDGGMVAGEDFTFCVGDAMEDNVAGITLSGNTGDNSQWVVTDTDGNILGLPPMPGAVNFEGAGGGTCLIWHLSYDDGLEGLQMGNNVSVLDGCYDLSDEYITVTRNNVDGGELQALTGNVYNRAVIANRASGTISVINVDNDMVEGTYEMPDDGEPMYVVYNDFNNSVLVGDYNGKVAVFDGKSFAHLGSATAGAGVFHMWLSPDHQQLWVNNELDKTISVINPNTLETIATIQTPADLLEGGYKPHDVIVMPNNAAAFVTFLGGDVDYVVKFSATTFEETDRVAVGADPHVSLTANTPYLYVASQGSSELKVLSRMDLSEVKTLDIPNAHGLGMNNAGTILYVGNIADGGANATYSVDLMENVVIGDPVDAPFSAPHNYAVSSDDSKLFLTHSGPSNNTVSIYDLSPTPTLITSVEVGNNPFGLVAYTYVETAKEVTICAGDNAPDAFDVALNGAEGTNSAWVITDTELNILALPAGPPFDLDGAGAGTCLIWHLSYEDGLQGATMGANAADLEGCFNLSNPITVVRYEGNNNGGEVIGDDYAFCVGDGVEDNVAGVSVSGAMGTNSQWVVTDLDGNILGLPPTPEAVNFDGAGGGTCLIWHLSYEDGLTGVGVGENVSNLAGCYDLSDNYITVVRNQPDGGEVIGDAFTFCVGDGVEDYVSGVSVTGATGSNGQWVITDADGNILGLPPTPEAVNFDEAGTGICLIWHLSYEDGLAGLEMGENVSNLEGCFDLSDNYAIVIRSQLDGGTVAGDDFAFCTGDGVEDNVAGVSISGAIGSNPQWVVTDLDGNILGLPPTPEAVNFDGAGGGTCLIWHLSYEDGLTGLSMGENVSNLVGCYDLSDNYITVMRTQPEGGEVVGSDYTFCVEDGIEDNVTDVSVTGTMGGNAQWVVTDLDGNILGLPPTPEAVNFDGAGVGTCLIWHLSYQDGLTGLAMDQNLANLEGCYDLSDNFITVERLTGADCSPACTADGGTVAGEDYVFCVGDDIADNVSDVTVSGASGTNSQWVVTDLDGNILGLPPTPEAVNFDGAGSGTCLIWHLSFEDGLMGAAVGMNAADLEGCYDLSDNYITVYRNQPEGGMVNGSDYTFCVGDDIADNVSGVTVSGASGTNSQWVVTDLDGNILGLPPTPEAVNFDGAGSGTCLMWHLSYEDGLTGAAMGMNAADLEGCYDLSDNYITVTRVTGADCNSAGVDLELAIDVADGFYDQYEEVDYTIVIHNTGDAPASGVVVSAPLPEGMVFTDADATQGDYELYFEEWYVGELGAGASATLYLTLFTKVEGVDINNFVQVVAQDQQDVDSTPDNNNGVTPEEDDEAVVTIRPRVGGGVGNGDGSIDLSLNITADQSSYDQYENLEYMITLTNNGPDAAHNLIVNAGLPDGMVYTSSNTSIGDYELYFEQWSIEELAAGETATLYLNLFTLVEEVDITNFVEVFSAAEADVDSTPGNGNGVSPQEDDEAAVTIGFEESSNAPQLLIDATIGNASAMRSAVFPNPALTSATLMIHQELAVGATVIISDVSGKLQMQRKIALEKGSNTIDLNIVDLSLGNHFIQIITESGERANLRFVKIAN